MKTKITNFLLALVLSALTISATAQVPSYVPTSGLKAWYPLDGNATDVHGTYTASLVGSGTSSTTNRFGAAGSALNFSGTGYYSHSGSLPISGTAFTISVWVRSNGTNQANGVFSQWDPTSTLSGLSDNVGFQTGIGTGAHAGQLEYSFKREAINTSINYSTLTISNDTVWKSLIITYDGSDTLTVYVNGAATYTIDGTNIPSSIGTMATLECIGKVVNAGTDVKFIGDMDDMGIWDRPLNSCERWMIVNSTDTAMHPITGTTVVCQGSSVSLADSATGGIWYTESTGISVGSTSGIVTATSVGADTVTYVRNFGTCGSDTASAYITVNALPNAGTITGPSTVLVGSSITLTDAATGGTWSSANSTAIVIGGTVTGSAYGTDTVIYVSTNSCGSDTASHVVTVDTTVTSVLSVYSQSQQDSVRLYPMPATNTITLVTSSPVINVTIIDQTGRQVLSKNDPEIDVTCVAAGQYVMVVQTSTSVTKHSIIIVH